MVRNIGGNNPHHDAGPSPTAPSLMPKGRAAIKNTQATGTPESQAHARASALSAKSRRVEICGQSGAPAQDVERPPVNDGSSE